jgi:hypothetical protein
MLQMQQMMAQMEQQNQGQQAPPEEAPLARYGSELSKAQEGNKGKSFDGGYYDVLDTEERTEQPIDYTADFNDNGIPDYLESSVEQKGVIKPSSAKSKQVKRSNKSYDSYDQDALDKYYTDMGVTINKEGVVTKSHAKTQAYNEDGNFGGSASNAEGWLERWSGEYPDAKKMIESIKTQGDAKKNPDVEKFQKWHNDVYIPQTISDIQEKRVAAGYDPFTEEESNSFKSSLIKDFGFSKDKVGWDVDGKFGTNTSGTGPIEYSIDAKGEVIADEKEKKDPIETIIPEEYTQPKPEWWMQDQNNLIALGQIEDNLYLPWAPDAENVNVSPTFDDWRAQVNANNASASTMAQALGAVGGPQAVANSNIQGQAMEANAKAINRVNSNNVQTANRASAMQAQYDDRTNMENARRKTKVYDDTQKTLQASDNFRNWRVAENAKLQNAALTNRANTANLNSTFDNMAIDPTTGGVINMTNPRGLEKVGDPGDRSEQFWNRISEFQKNSNTTEFDKGLWDAYNQEVRGTQSGSNQNKYQQSLAANNGRTGRAKAGKEIKKMIVPFYTGKMGG